MRECVILSARHHQPWPFYCNVQQHLLCRSGVNNVEDAVQDPWKWDFQCRNFRTLETLSWKHEGSMKLFLYFIHILSVTTALHNQPLWILCRRRVHVTIWIKQTHSSDMEIKKHIVLYCLCIQQEGLKHIQKVFMAERDSVDRVCILHGFHHLVIHQPIWCPRQSKVG